MALIRYDVDCVCVPNIWYVFRVNLNLLYSLAFKRYRKVHIFVVSMKNVLDYIAVPNSPGNIAYSIRELVYFYSRLKNKKAVWSINS